MEELKPLCFKCQTAIELERVSRRDECLKCHSDIHVCLNCINYSLGYYNDCLESQADRVIDKEKANFCDYFKLKATCLNKQSKEDVFKKADSLFK